MRKDKQDLAELIRQYPNAVFEVDNDQWWMYPSENDVDTVIAESGGVLHKGGIAYGMGALYGTDILYALAEIVGVKIESI